MKLTYLDGIHREPAFEKHFTPFGWRTPPFPIGALMREATNNHILQVLSPNTFWCFRCGRSFMISTDMEFAFELGTSPKRLDGL